MAPTFLMFRSENSLVTPGATLDQVRGGLRRNGIHRALPRSAKIKMDYTRLLPRALRAIRYANVRSGILPPQSRLRGNDGVKEFASPVLFTTPFPPPLLRNCDRELRPLRSADEAGRHALQFVQRRLLARTQVARVHAENVAERTPERPQALPAGLESDVGDRQVRVAQQRRGPLDPAREQIPVRRQAERLLERPREVRLGHAAHARQAADRPFLVRGGVHAVLGAEQAAQEVGGLAWRPSFIGHKVTFLLPYCS